jgi:hypothetical protein
MRHLDAFTEQSAWFGKKYALVVDCAYGRQEETEETASNQVEGDRQKSDDAEEKAGCQESRFQEGISEKAL